MKEIICIEEMIGDKLNFCSESRKNAGVCSKLAVIAFFSHQSNIITLHPSSDRGFNFCSISREIAHQNVQSAWKVQMEVKYWIICSINHRSWDILAFYWHLCLMTCLLTTFVIIGRGFLCSGADLLLMWGQTFHMSFTGKKNPNPPKNEIPKSVARIG